MAVYRDIDHDTRINGKLSTASADVLGVLKIGNIADVEAAINSKIGGSGGVIVGDISIDGSLTVTGGITGIDLSQYYTKLNLETAGSASVHWDNITGYVNPGYAILSANNVFTANSNAIKIRPQTNPSTNYTNEALIFSSDTGVLQNKPINAMSEVVTSDAVGTITYARDVDYTINYKTGQVNRIPEGSILPGATVYVDYTKTAYMITVVNPTDTEVKFGVDNEGNIHGKSISVLLSSSVDSSGGESQGDFNIGGNLLVSGNSIFGDNPALDKTVIKGTLEVENSIGTVVFSIGPDGYIYLGGTRKDSLWDSAYSHSIDTSVHMTATDFQNITTSLNHANSAHGPSDAPTGTEFNTHKNDTVVHVTPEDKTRWDTHLELGEISTTAYRGDRGKLAYDHIATNGSSHTFIDQDVTVAASPTFNKITTVNGFSMGTATIVFNPVSKTLDFIFI